MVERCSGPLGGLRQSHHRPRKLEKYVHGPQLLYVDFWFCENLVCGTIFDSCLKSLINNTTNVQSIEQQTGISETLAEIKALVDVDVADSEAIEDADTPASTESHANIEIIVKNARREPRPTTPPKWL